MTTMKAIGFIGLGRMGAGMALNLIKQVDSLYVFDEQAIVSARLEEAGATVCSSASEVANHCDLIFLCLPYAPQVRQTLFEAGGIAESSRNSQVVIDTTTLDRQDALDIGAKAERIGLEYWDSPVSGMPFRADNGTLTVMFGGTSQAFDKAKPYLDCFGNDVRHCGERGCGQAMKAINNIIYNINIAALCEVLPLAVAVGLDPLEVASVVTTASSRSFASEYFVPRMLERRFDTDFAMQDAYKDIVNIQRMGIETRASLPVVNAMVSSYQAAMAAGYGAEPKSAMLKVYEQALGVQFSSAGGAEKQPT